MRVCAHTFFVPVSLQTSCAFHAVGGQDLAMSVTIALSESVTSASYSIIGYYFGVEYVSYQGNGCGPDSCTWQNCCRYSAYCLVS